MNETEKENVKEAEEEEEEEEGIWVRDQRKIKRKRSRRRRRREEQLADRLDLAPASDGGQRQRQRAEVRGQTSVIFLFFSTAGVSEPRRSHSEPCQRSEKKKKKRDTRRTPESGESYPYRCPTPTRRQKWRVRATFLSTIVLLSTFNKKLIKCFNHTSHDGPTHEMLLSCQNSKLL